jgi:hypothetical protein
MSSEIAFFADYIALAYHEARNVRRLVRAGHLERTRYRLLIDGLPTNRIEAWRKIQSLRREAAGAANVHEAEAVFGRAFELSLEDLVSLSENPNWRGTQTGGNRWAEIDRKLVELRNAIDQSDEKRATELRRQLPQMCHNTGRLGEKFQSLDRPASISER